MAKDKTLEELIAPSKIWETIYDLSYLAGNDKLVETPYYDNDSRELYGNIQMWAIEFEKKFNIDFDKSEFDYLIEIDKFYEEKKNQVLAYKE
jgi:hypothetical protein